MVDYNKIVIEIMKHLGGINNHILQEKCTDNYYKDFFDSLDYLWKSNVINSKKDLKSFLGKMQLTKSFDELKYYKGISEIMFWIYASKQDYKFSLEKKLQTDRNFDIDLQILKNDFIFNVEIKSPDFNKLNNEILGINTSFRSHSKEESETVRNTVIQDIVNPILIHKNNNYSDFTFTKINDNKLLDYLKSGQQKFNDSDESSINVLIISVTSEQMQDYWGYLYNGFTGLFTDSSFCRSEEYDKVDVVLLTNLVSGHRTPRNEINSWDLNEYFNLFCTNPFSKKKLSSSKCSSYTHLLSLFPNSTSDFDNFYTDLTKKIAVNDIPLEGLLFPAYISERYPLLK